MKNHKTKRSKSEHGAIAVMTAFMMTLMITFLALSFDIGMHYYYGAKLQNAVDSAASAVAGSLGADEDDLYSVAYKYLAKNGYDYYDDYKDRMTVDIQSKGVLTEEATQENGDDYITSGFYKITVTVKDKSFFASVAGINDFTLTKTACVRCQANYVDMPDALKYTVFAGSATGQAANPALRMDGRTGSTVNGVVSIFEQFINAVNSGIVQPIIGIFGGTPDYTDLVHINLSEIVTNGDVHSNSNISIGVQALNASRVKDHDFDDNSDNDNGEAYDKAGKDDNDYDDYGQVTYTAVTDIMFNNSLKNNMDDSTHVYVQNQQYLEQTQAALNIINKIDFSQISTTQKLQEAYLAQAQIYLDTQNTMTSSQKQAIANQYENLEYVSENKFALKGQSMVVYDVSQGRAEKYLADFRNEGLDALIDELGGKTDPMYSDSENTILKYANVADKQSGIDYDITFRKTDDDGKVTSTAAINVSGTTANRDLSNISSSSMDTATNTGAKFAVARTFLEQSEYISVPNMKPYFVRQINQSVSNATTKKYEMGEDETGAAKNIKQAIQNSKSDFSKISTYNGNNAEFDAKKATSTLFSKYKSSYDASPVNLTNSTTQYTSVNNNTITLSKKSYKGFNLYNSDGTLKNSNDFIDEFESGNSKFGNVRHGAEEISKFYESTVKTTDSHAYATDAVSAKKTQLKDKYTNAYEKVEYSDVTTPIADSLPAVRDVFLRGGIIDGGVIESNVAKEEYNPLMEMAKQNISTYMPTINKNSLTITTTESAPWNDGTASTVTLSSNTDWSKDGWQESDISQTSSKTLSSGIKRVHIGKIEIKNSGSIIVSYRNLDINANSTLYVEGNVSSKNVIQVRENSILYVNGDINTNGLWLESGAKVVCTGTITIEGWSDKNGGSGTVANSTIITNNLVVQNANVRLNGTTVITGTTSGSGFTASTAYVLEKDAVMVCNGDFNLNGQSSNRSFSHKGRLFVSGNLSAVGEIYLEYGEIYCMGDLSGANSYGSNVLDFYNDGKVYIGGALLTNGSNRHIWFRPDVGSGSVLSVYGTLSQVMSSNIVEFCNDQPNTQVYLDGYYALTPSLRTIYIPSGTSSTYSLVNKGKMYVYTQMQVADKQILSSGTFYVAGDFTFYGSAATFTGTYTDTTYVKGNLSCNNAVVTVSSGNTAVCKKLYAKGINITGGARVYATDALNITYSASGISSNSYASAQGFINIETSSADHVSFLYGGKYSTYNSYLYLTANGKCYLPDMTYNLYRIDIGPYGYFATDGNITVSTYAYVQEGGMLYCGGKMTVVDCRFKNNGKMYFVGEFDYSAAKLYSDGADVMMESSNSETYLGATSTGTLTYTGWYQGNGDVYIENNLIVNGYTGGTKVGNRNTAFYVASGSTYIAGNVRTCDANGFKIEKGAGVSCEDCSVGSTIYNFGYLYIKGNFESRECDYCTDRNVSESEKNDFEKLRTGYSIKNGNSDATDAVLYIGGKQDITFVGYVMNFGRIYSNASMKIRGYFIYGMVFGTRPTRTEASNNWPRYAPHISLENFDNSQFHCAGNVETYSAIYNHYNAESTSDGYFKYGMAILNGGVFYAAKGTGYADEHYELNHIEVFENSTYITKKGSYSIVNGFVNNTTDGYNRNAIFYAGGDQGITLGTVENETDDLKVGGTFQNWGTAYIRGDFNVYSNKGLAYNISSIILQNETNTFIGGRCFSSSVTALMNNTIFMCDGDLTSKRAMKINIGEEFRDDDFFQTNYTYVGGNLLANTMGTASGDSTNGNDSRDLDIYSNANIFVGGSMYANCQVYMKQNVSIVVAGLKKLWDKNGNVLESIINDIVSGTTGETMKKLIYGDKYTMFIYMALDENIYSSLCVNGNMFVRDTSKIRDNTRNYIFGDYIGNGYIEIGKSLNSSSEGDTYIYCNCCENCTGNPGCHSKTYADGTPRPEDEICTCSDCVCDDFGEDDPNDIEDTSQKASDIAAQLASDASDGAHGSVCYIKGSLVSYNGYLTEYAYTEVTVGRYVYVPQKLNLHHNADLWVVPEMFGNSTYVHQDYQSSITEDSTFLERAKDFIDRIKFEIEDTFSPKNGSVYTFGELRMNKNASLIGTYDNYVSGQCIFDKNALIYMGHDFSCTAPSLNLSWASITGKDPLAGFYSAGDATYHEDTGKQTSFPVVVYANNDINISTTVDMKMTYLIANEGDVNLYDVYTETQNADTNARELPNSIASFKGDINYTALYGKIGALFYAPKGNIDFGGWYEEVWGSVLGNTIEMNTYYLSLHRFTNWRSMDLHIAQSGNVYFISESEFDSAPNNVDSSDMYDNNDWYKFDENTSF
ncbi:MAG: pilus assembly protein TadG-related protein [Eubacterium sp.]